MNTALPINEICERHVNAAFESKCLARFISAFILTVLLGLETSGQLTTVINVPPDAAPESIGSDTQLNLFSGGHLPRFFDAGVPNRNNTNVEVNIFGGTIDWGFEANRGSKVVISGGRLSGGVSASSGSEVTISGGSIGDNFRGMTGAAVLISGDDFQLNGVSVQGLDDEGSIVSVDVPSEALLTGILADGTPFAFSSGDYDSFAPGVLTLEKVALPPVGPSLIRASTDTLPPGIRSGQTLLVDQGSVVADGFSAGEGSTVRVEAGGSVGQDLEAIGADVEISGGSVADSFDAFRGANVTMTGGSVGSRFHVFDGSSVTISDGFIGGAFRLYPGSTATIRGGFFEYSVKALGGSTVDISGGSFGDGFFFGGETDLTIAGGEFRLDGALIAGLENEGDQAILDMPREALFSGTLADGTPFAFLGGDLDFLAAGSSTLVATRLPAIGPDLIVASRDPIPRGIRQGQTLKADDGSMIPSNFNVGFGGTMTVETGSNIGRNLEAVDAQVVVSGGDVGDHFDAFRSNVMISGGQIGNEFDAVDAEIMINGGSVGHDFKTLKNSFVEITGGSVGSDFVTSDSEVAITGGSIASGFRAENSTVTIAGGSIGDWFTTLNSDVQISGGTIGNIFTPRGGTTVTVTGGSIGYGFHAQEYVTVTIRGGSIGDSFDPTRNATVSIAGSDFRLNGELLEGLDTVGAQITFEVPQGSLVAGTLSDGTPFAFSDEDDDLYGGDALTLEAANTPPIDDSLIIASTSPIPLGIRQGQTLRVDAGGVVLDNFNAGRGSTVHIEPGGNVGNNFEAVAATITVSGGSIGDDFDAFRGTNLTITSGSFGNNFDAFDGSTVTVAGGTFGDDFDAYSGAMVTMTGTDFRLDGVPVVGLDNVGDTITLDVPRGALFSGTFADGTPFVIWNADGDTIEDGVLTLRAAEPPPIGSSLIVAPTDAVPLGIREGQTLRVTSGAVIPDHFVAGEGSTVDVGPGGVIADNFEALGAVVHIRGSVGDDFDAFRGTVVLVSEGSIGNDAHAHSGSLTTITDGSVGERFYAEKGSRVRVAGGTVGEDFAATEGSEVSVSGGVFGDDFRVNSGTSVRISGGSFQGRVYVWDGGNFHLFGKTFFLDGAAIAGLEHPGDTVTLDTRDLRRLTGTLLDGNGYDFLLNASDPFRSDDYFHENATLQLTLPLIGDLDLDGDTDSRDIDAFVLSLISRRQFQWTYGSRPEIMCDMDGDGDNDFDDIDDLVAVFSNAMSNLHSSAVPEPGTLWLLVPGIAALGICRRPRGIWPHREPPFHLRC